MGNFFILNIQPLGHIHDKEIAIIKSREEELKNIKMNRVPAASVSNLYCLDMQ